LAFYFFLLLLFTVLVFAEAVRNRQYLTTTVCNGNYISSYPETPSEFIPYRHDPASSLHSQVRITPLTIPSAALDGHLSDAFKAQSHMPKSTGKEQVVALSTKKTPAGSERRLLSWFEIIPGDAMTVIQTYSQLC